MKVSGLLYQASMTEGSADRELCCTTLYSQLSLQGSIMGEQHCILIYEMFENISHVENVVLESSTFMRLSTQLPKRAASSASQRKTLKGYINQKKKKTEKMWWSHLFSFSGLIFLYINLVILPVTHFLSQDDNPHLVIHGVAVLSPQTAVRIWAMNISSSPCLH